MGCKAITPHLVSLASRLEGKPFHLVASHCQRNTRDNVVRYVQSKGLAADTPNVTVTSMGRHPKVKGNGYVPYYAVFDHRGKLIYHHMCGDYHGGDGLRMIEWVDKLLKDAPALYLGEEPYEHITDLALNVSRRKRLYTQVAKIEKLLANDTTDEATRRELERLQATLQQWRDRERRLIAARLGTRPSTVIPALKKLATELARTELGAPLVEEMDTLGKSADLRTALILEAALKTAKKSLGKVEGKRGSEKVVTKLLDTLEQTASGIDLPMADTIREFVAARRSA